MLWAIYCTDQAGSAALRETHGAAHRAHLMASKDKLVFAAPLQSDDGTAAVGTLFVLNAASREEAAKFSDSDAFTQNGVFQSVTITSLRRGLLNPEAVDNN